MLWCAATAVAVATRDAATGPKGAVQPLDRTAVAAASKAPPPAYMYSAYCSARRARRARACYTRARNCKLACIGSCDLQLGVRRLLGPPQAFAS